MASERALARKAAQRRGRANGPLLLGLSVGVLLVALLLVLAQQWGSEPPAREPESEQAAASAPAPVEGSPAEGLQQPAPFDPPRPQRLALDEGAAQQAASLPVHDYDPWEFGIVGRVGIQGREGFGYPSGRVAARNGRGEGFVDSLALDGEFHMWGLGPGAWEFVVEVPGVGFHEQSVHLSELEPVQEVLLQLSEPDSIEVRLSCEAGGRDDRFQRGRMILVGHDAEGKGARTTRADLREHFAQEFEAAPFRRQGGYVTTCWFGGRRPRALSLFHDGLLVATRELQPEESVVEWPLASSAWPLAPGSIEVRARDAVSLSPLNAWVNPLGVLSYEVDVGEPGTTSLRGLRPGWRQISISHDGYEKRIEWLFVPPGGIAQREVMLETGVVIRGFVVGAEGAVVQRGVIAWRVDSETDTIAPRLYSSRPTSDGGFVFAALRPGTYHLRTLGSDEGSNFEAVTSEFVTVDAQESVSGVRLELLPVGHLLLDPVGAFDEPYEYRLEDLDGRWLRSGSLRTTESRRIEVARGRYRLVVRQGEETVDRWEGELGASPLVRRF